MSLFSDYIVTCFEGQVIKATAEWGEEHPYAIRNAQLRTWGWESVAWGTRSPEDVRAIHEALALLGHGTRRAHREGVQRLRQLTSRGGEGDRQAIALAQYFLGVCLQEGTGTSKWCGVHLASVVPWLVGWCVTGSGMCLP